MTNERHTVLYTGVTNDLKRRVYEHKEKRINGYTKRYNVNQLVYYECVRGIDTSIAREKQIKGGSRKKKISLIESMNMEWRDLFEEIL